jgi:DNA-binding NtrC family response regulator
MLVSAGTEIRADDLSLDEQKHAGSADGAIATPTRDWEVRPLDEVTDEYIRAAVAAAGGNMRKAARLLDISPSTLYARLRER